MNNYEKTKSETMGEIISVMQFNSWVYMTLKVYGEISKIEIPRLYCCPKNLKRGDVIKLTGNIEKYEKANNKNPSRTIYSRCTVERILTKGVKNNKIDFAANFSFLGYILFDQQIDCEFYQLTFELVTGERDIVTIYIDKYHWEEFKKSWDAKRLINICGKMSVTSYYKHSYDIPISDIRNYAVSLEYV